MKLQIRKYPDPILSQKTTKIKDPLDKEIQDLVTDMLETLHSGKNSVGLAAPQVGAIFRLCVVDLGEKPYVLINPKITAQSRKKEICEEGCLSFPDEFYPVSRSSEVQVRYVDEKGKPNKIKAQGLFARVLQHEIDHLDGILFISKVKKNILKKSKFRTA